MLLAQLHGKLGREQENLEDILTSNTFGVFSYLEPTEALLPLLMAAEGERAVELQQLLGAASGWQATYEFWPWLEQPNCKGCEPDVLVRLDASTGERVLVCIEAKYRSGKSSRATDLAVPVHSPPNDQLAREWSNVESVAAAERRRAFLVYVTSSYVLPHADLEASESELVRLRDRRAGFLWLSWRAVSRLPPGTSRILASLLRLMSERYQLTEFGGITAVGRSLSWRYAGEPASADEEHTYAWPGGRTTWNYAAASVALEATAMPWTFNRAQTWRWR
jgi:hypothetical protein